MSGSKHVLQTLTKDYALSFGQNYVPGQHTIENSMLIIDTGITL